MKNAHKSNEAENYQRYDLGLNDRIIVKDIEYRLVRSDEGGHVFYRVSHPDVYERISHGILAKYREDGLFKFTPDYHAPSRARNRDTIRQENILDLSEKNRERIFWCKEFCDSFLLMEKAGEASRSDESMLQAIRTINAKVVEIETKKQKGENGRCGAEVKTKSPPSPTQLRKWLKKYEATDRDPIVLKFNYGKCGNRTPRLEPEIVELIDKYAAEHSSRTRAKPSVIYTDLIAELEVINTERAQRGESKLDEPSIRALQRAVDKLDPYLDYVGRNGEAAAKKKFYPVQGGVRARLPFERIEMDEWMVSLQTLMVNAGMWKKLTKEQKKKAKRVRVWVSAAIDAATRCIIALRILKTAPNYESAIATLRMAVSNKRAIAEAAGCQSSWDMEGTPRLVCVDTGASWYSDEFRMACSDLGIEVMYAPAGMPQFRARIERVFGTIHSQLIARFDGRTFANILAKGDYDAAAHAIMNIEQLERLMIRYIVDVYHNTGHSGLGEETPANAWKRLRKDWGVRPGPDADEIRHVFGTPMERLIQNEGIHCLGNWYRSPATHAMRRSMGSKQKQVMVRIDQLNVGEISVRFNRVWVTVPCAREGLDGVSAHEWFEMNSDLRRKHRADAKAVRPIVNAAVRDFRAFREKAVKDAGLEMPVYTYKQLMRLEGWFKRAGEQTRAAESDPADFLGDAEVPDDFVERDEAAGAASPDETFVTTTRDDGFMDEEH
ncbi:putative transposase [Phyllobacterium trifolii]|uniref:Putative transposase n=1 Tax=Phyllobacterium trifolii TaxID=300193 RepID=A0A839UKQ7_9HYPH|nr:Mu transposase C-terminal domain-containing protein [Phyllobacterium trifolii]MBB3149201.1 putative transposase [Phyllobacterium trifolii]